jgi:uncharacterized protein (TIGR00730 family)
MAEATQEQQIRDAIHSLVRDVGGDPETFEGDLVAQLMHTGLKALRDGHDTGQLKLMTRALKEIRYAYRVFNEYPGRRRISIFGSARTPEDHPDYIACKAFSAGIADAGWMCITGAADGIMKAGHEGPTRDSSFGLSIRLPFESPTNSVLSGDPKLISFNYFFTRKLMFMSHSDAVAAFPGGVGTQDELFETLTLMQTGKSNIIPVVLCEGKAGVYWHYWHLYFQKSLLANGWVSPEDENFFYIAPTPEDAVAHVQHFYKRYHSSRYVGDQLVLRLKSPLSERQVDVLNQSFPMLLASGEMRSGEALPEEEDHLELPRLIFHHNRRGFGHLRALIDQVNDF